MKTYCGVLLLYIILSGCSTDDYKSNNTLYAIVPSSRSGIEFINEITISEELNPYTFRNFFNGAGVGIGDINNDGLPDIFLCGNMVSNKLYLNKSNLIFEDITDRSGLHSKGVWTTGVSLVDINADGLLDIYLCKSGPPGGNKRHNELFINKGNLTFAEESAKWGLAFEGLSSHAAFFDYDKDGDLDCYLLNNSLRPIGAFDLRPGLRNIPDSLGGNKLLRNDRNKFIDVTEESGIYSSQIGFGLGITLGDINNDDWTDIFISNDFFERDYLYINNKNGTFNESLDQFIREISLGSMGADLADINNDGLPEIFVTEMLPEHLDRIKTAAQFESYDKYKQNIKAGYYHQFGRNVLQLNRGNNTFSEIGRMAGVHATDWSWGALLFDMNNDGFKDIFVANGIYKDLLDQDYVNYVANPDFIRKVLFEKGKVVKQLVDSIPSTPISNYAFKNNGDLTFTNTSVDWGFDVPTFSNGSAYGDLDNDGDLDLVVNNVNMISFIQENRSNSTSQNHSLQIQLKGDSLNKFAIGTKVIVYSDGRTLMQELFPSRGFMSSVDYLLHFGLGAVDKIDSILVYWPDGKISKEDRIPENTERMSLVWDLAELKNTSKEKVDRTLFEAFKVSGVEFMHRENDYVDFDRDKLMFNMTSNEGPCICVSDVDQNGLDDFYIGGAKEQPGKLFLQSIHNKFTSAQFDLFEKDKDSEDTDCVFFDADGDGWKDLYVTSGGAEFSSSSYALVDRLYINKHGILSRSNQILPSGKSFESTSTVNAADLDKDGDLDLFVGSRLMPFQYGFPADGYILINDGSGKFSDQTQTLAPELIKSGMITSSGWTDLDNDGQTDLVIAGEWMGPKIFINRNGALKESAKILGLDSLDGWYNDLGFGDFNNDGFVDIVLANHGLNSRFKASKVEPVNLWVNDFDSNGAIEQILTLYDNGISYPLVLRNDLLSQVPVLKKKFLYFHQYKAKTIQDIFSAKQISNALKLNAFWMETTLLLNQGGKSFKVVNLLHEAQFAPVYSILVDDFNGDSNQDIILGGNLYRAKPETGIYDASYGVLLIGNGDGKFSSMELEKSGLLIKGEIRSIKKIKVGNRQVILFGINNNNLQALTY